MIRIVLFKSRYLKPNFFYSSSLSITKLIIDLLFNTVRLMVNNLEVLEVPIFLNVNVP